MSTLKPIACQSCGASSFEHDEQGNLICTHCGMKFASPREEILCPACGVANQPDAKRCMNCGLTLGKLCPVCNHLNPPGAEFCLDCASPLDTLSSVTSRMGEGKKASDALRERKLVGSKNADMQFMQRERERLDQMERERLADLVAQQARSRKQQTYLIVGSFLFVLAIVCLVIAAVLLVR
jgi:predicted amidophosphoribosyltransferase